MHTRKLQSKRGKRSNSTLRASIVANTASVNKLARTSEFRVAVIGGGFTGTAFILNLIRLMLRSKPSGIAKIRVLWFDANRAYGRGLPYAKQCSADEGVFLLNQPAYAQSPFSDEPDLYSRWIERNYQLNHCTFTSRTLFGLFLETQLNNHLRLARHHRLPLVMERVPERVQDVVSKADRYEIVTASDGERVDADAVVLAIGHLRHDPFQSLSGAPAYVSNPYDLDSYRAALHSAAGAKNVILIGGGPTTVDAVRALEHLNYQGRYTIITGSNQNLWAFEPELYLNKPIRSYQFVHLIPENLHAENSYDELAALLRRELKNAHRLGFGPGHVYYGFDLDCLAPYLRSNNLAFKHFYKELLFLKGGVTAPENCVLYQRLKQQRRITRYRGRALADNSSYSEDLRRFKISFRNSRGRLANCYGDILINCSQLPKRLEQPLRNELLSNLLRRDLIKLTENGLIAAAGNRQCTKLLVLGPHAEPPAGGTRTVWGVESLRDEIKSAAKEVMAQYEQDRTVPKVSNCDQ